MLNLLKKLWSQPVKSQASRTARPSLELLEDRLMPTWGGIPPATITPPTTAVAVTLNSSGAAANTASITASEVDYYSVIPATTGGYSLTATRTGPSPLQNPVLGLFDATGNRIAYNNDRSAFIDTNSKIELANLTAGQRYYFGVTNLSGTASGGYLWTVSRATVSDDASENNDTLASATKLGLLTQQTRLSDRVLMDAADYYQFSMEGYGTATSDVSINFDNGQGNLNLALYNSAGALLASSSSTTANGETISLANRAPGVYSLRVTGASGCWSPRYGIVINPGVDDRYENNDTMATAYDLGALSGIRTVSNLQLVDSGDYYRFSMDGIGDVSDYVRINFQNAQGNLDLKVQDSNGTIFRSSTTNANEERISLAGMGPGVYYVRVFAKDEVSFNRNYTLEIAPALDDAFENNDTMEQAYNLGVHPTMVTGLQLADDADWYYFAMTGFGLPEHFIALADASNIQLSVYDGNGVPVPTSPSLQVSLNGLAPGSYFLKVDSPTGQLASNYTLNFHLPTEDAYENNDDMQHAALLDVHAEYEMQLLDTEDWFRFSLDNPGNVGAYVEIETSSGGGYLQLELIDEDGNVVETTGTFLFGRVSLEGLAPRSYVLRVTGLFGAINAYSLKFNLN
jgi:hypothetical protein